MCDACFGPLEVVYDYDRIKQRISRRLIESRPPNIWRYQEFLPLSGEPQAGLHTGFTPLVQADRLAAALGVEAGCLYIKDDSVNHPSFS